MLSSVIIVSSGFDVPGKSVTKRKIMAAERPDLSGLLSGSESEGDVFEGFDCRDTRRFSEVARKANLFTSTPVPKRKRNANDTSSSDESFRVSSSDETFDDPELSRIDTVKVLSTSADPDSPTSSVEGEVVVSTFSSTGSRFSSRSLLEPDKADCSAESSSSIEGEVWSTENSSVAELQSTSEPVNASLEKKKVHQPSPKNTEHARKKGD